MFGVGGTEHLLGFGGEIRPPDIFDVQSGQHHPLGVAKGQVIADREFRGESLWNVERDRHRPQGSVLQPHVGADTVVVGAGHEAGEG